MEEMTMEEVTRITVDLIRSDIQGVLRDPVTLCNALREFKVIDESLLKSVLQMVSRYDDDFIWDHIFKELPRRCTVYEIEKALDKAGYKDIAQRLKRLASKFLGQCGINSSVPCSVQKRQRLQLFFKDLKRRIYNGTDYSLLKHMSGHMEGVLFSNAPQNGKITPDKYVITLAVMLDSPIEENELFIHGLTEEERFHRQGIISKLEQIISKTPNQDISSMFLFSRMAIEHSLTGDFQGGEDCVNLALQHASSVGICVEKADMFYRIAHFYHRMFEFTKEENALKHLRVFGEHGISCLEREQEEVRHQWKRLFLLRMVLCLLGMSTECREIQDRIYCRQHVACASEYLAKVDKAWEGIERKAMLLYFMARTRLCDVQDQIEDALHYAKDLKKVAEENKSKHLVFIVQYIHDLEALQPSGQSLLVTEDTGTRSNTVMRREVGDGSSEENSLGVNEQVSSVIDSAQYSSLSGPEALVLVDLPGNPSINQNTARNSPEQEDESIVHQLHELKIVIQHDEACIANSKNIPSQADQIDWQNFESSSFNVNFAVNNASCNSTILQNPLQGELSDSDAEQIFSESREEPEGASLP